MDLRPERRSTYGIGRMCEKSAVGMRRCDQWQVIKCSAWRNVQHGECKRTPLVPLGNVTPFPKPLQEEPKKRCEDTCPFTKRTATVTRQNRGTFLAGIRNEGKSGYMGFMLRHIPCNGMWLVRRTLNLARKGSTGATSKRGIRHTCEGAPTLDERNEPVNLGSPARNVKAPRPANVRVGRRSNRSSLSRLISGPYTKGCSKDRTPSTKHCRKLEAASVQSTTGGRDFTHPEDRSPSFEEGGREIKPMNIGVVGRHGTEGEIPRGFCGEPRYWQTSTPGSGRRLGETALINKRKPGVT
ncbi:hypothetical protein GGP72_000595 [Salinibacter ruber]|uniref:Uncharacterized protein n=1 Tax=Salinibacter ruber TaxID=146919 RepID=A0A9X2PTS6_9BACT|nr:hypothetical protein [Salinibacter ruber]MCS3679975.1 hypothetical protein [Salinibacter ruber]